MNGVAAFVRALHRHAARLAAAEEQAIPLPRLKIFIGERLLLLAVAVPHRVNELSLIIKGERVHAVLLRRAVALGRDDEERRARQGFSRPRLPASLCGAFGKS